MTRTGRILGAFAATVLAVTLAPVAPARASQAPARLVSNAAALQAGITPLLRWTNQFGTDTTDEAEGVATDSYGNAYVVGYTAGSLPGQSSLGGYDAFLRKYATDGTERWTRQFGTAQDDVAFGVAVDGDGNAYVAGYTAGSLPGQTASGGVDEFVASFTTDGTQRWVRQFGGTSWEVAQSIAVDLNGDVFASGYTLDPRSGDEDGFVREFGAATGATGWAISLSSPFFDDARSVTTEPNGDVAVGGAYASAGFVALYTPDGSALWAQSLPGTVVNGVAASAGGVAAVGVAGGGALPGQTALSGSDAFAMVYSARGDTVWTRQFGSPADDAADAVAVNVGGDVIVAGSTAGALPGQTSSGGSDAFVTAYHSDGTSSWTTQFGTGATDLAFGLAVDGAGNVIVAGPTSGALPGQTSIGGSDAYVRSYGACQIIVRVDGSSTLMPVLGAAQLGFQALPANTGCSMTVAAGTTSQAIAALQAGTINAAAVSRPLTGQERSTLYAWQIGGDAMVIAVQASPAMSFLSNVTSAQVAAIYSGSITNWDALGGPDQPIVPRSSDIDAEDRADLLRLFGIADMDEQQTIAATGLPRLTSPYDEAAAAAANPYQIAYTSLADAHLSGLKVLSLDGVAPSALTVQSGAYSARRSFYLAMRKNSFAGAGLTDWSTVKAEDLVNYLLTSAGQQAMGQSGFVQTVLPATPPIPDRDVNVDGAIGLFDLGMVTAKWGQTSTCPGWIRADVNNDGAIGLADLGGITASWGSSGFVAPN